MSKFDFKKLREQINQSGDFLRENFRTTDNRMQANAQAAETRKNNPELWRRQKLATQKKSKESEYRKSFLKGNSAKLQDPKYLEAYYKGIKKRDSDQEYHQRRLAASKEKIKQPVLTPLGVFETQTDATRAHGFTNTERVRHRCKSPNFPDWQLITVEEYQRLREK